MGGLKDASVCELARGPEVSAGVTLTVCRKRLITEEKERRMRLYTEMTMVKTVSSTPALLTQPLPVNFFPQHPSLPYKASESSKSWTHHFTAKDDMKKHTLGLNSLGM